MVAVNYREKGFTLIELVSVIVILGILSVFAISRFADLSEQSHEAVYESAFSSFESAVKVYHAAWLANGGNGAVINLSSYGDGSIDSSSAGYPAGTNFGGSLNGSNCNELWESLVNTTLTTRASLGGSFDGDTEPPIKYWYGGNPADQTAYCYFIYVGHVNEPGVMLPTLRYYPLTGQTETLKVAYAN